MRVSNIFWDIDDEFSFHTHSYLFLTIFHSLSNSSQGQVPFFKSASQFCGFDELPKKKWKFFCTNFWGTKEGVYNILIQHLLPYIWVTTYTFNLNLKIHERTMTWGKLVSHLLAAVLKKFLVLCIWVRNVNLPSHLSTRHSVECSHRPWHF